MAQKLLLSCIRDGWNKLDVYCGCFFFHRARPYRCVKLMLVGEANRGKTSLLLNLTKISKGRMTHFSTVEMGVNDIPLSTVGVDLGEFKYSPHISKPVITFMTWDFGGQVRSSLKLYIGHGYNYICVTLESS